jgi:hypothetical protein
MRRGILVVGILALALGGCEDRRKKAIEKIDQDKEILQRVNAAVNEVIRNAPDCAVAKPLVPEAYQRIEEARGQVTAPASQQTLAALKVQVDRVADVCP